MNEKWVRRTLFVRACILPGTLPWHIAKGVWIVQPRVKDLMCEELDETADSGD